MGLIIREPVCIVCSSIISLTFQGEIVDSIEANVESTTVRVHEGTDQLRQAELYKVIYLNIKIIGKRKEQDLPGCFS